VNICLPRWRTQFSNSGWKPEPSDAPWTPLRIFAAVSFLMPSMKSSHVVLRSGGARPAASTRGEALASSTGGSPAAETAD